MYFQLKKRSKKTIKLHACVVSASIIVKNVKRLTTMAEKCRKNEQLVTFLKKNQDINVAHVMELLYLCRVIILNVWHTMLLT